jgi:dienelactone hydrolase
MTDEISHDLLRPMAFYETEYATVPRRFRTPDTTDPATWQHWRTAFTAALWERIGGQPQASKALDIRPGPVTEHAGYRREYITFESAPGVMVPAWVLIPDGRTSPGPAVVAVHGHGYGVDDIVRINADGTDRPTTQGYHDDFAVELCLRGLVVIAPEVLGFGRRRERAEQLVAPGLSSCRYPALWGIMQGKPLIGRRVWDIMRAIDVLETRPEVDASRIGIMGISGGGMVALFTAALEDRIRAAVISGYLSTFRDSILAVDHCLCNFVPGLLQDAEIEDIAALLAPRPLLIEAGLHDPIFPVAAVEQAYRHLERVYAGLGAPERLDKDIFDGDHRISGAKSYDFLADWLQR